MTDKPILFSGPMMRALLAGDKTQTRRVIKMRNEAARTLLDSGWADDYILSPENADWLQRTHGYSVGDRLWVRETWTHSGDGVWNVNDARSRGKGGVLYRADNDISGAGYFPSIFMPREFSRLTLTVTDVRVQRVQDISEDDAKAEGIAKSPHGNLDQWTDYPERTSAAGWSCPRDSFETLWDSINAKRGFSWDSNPWAVALTFDVHQANIDQLR